MIAESLTAPYACGRLEAVVSAEGPAGGGLGAPERHQGRRLSAAEGAGAGAAARGPAAALHALLRPAAPLLRLLRPRAAPVCAHRGQKHPEKGPLDGTAERGMGERRAASYYEFFFCSLISMNVFLMG